MNIKVGDWVKSLETVDDIQKDSKYLVIKVAEYPFITVIDDVGDQYSLSENEYELLSEPEATPEVLDNTYTLNISLQGTGTFFTKTKDIVLPTGTDLIELISKLNEL